MVRVSTVSARILCVRKCQLEARIRAYQPILSSVPCINLDMTPPKPKLQVYKYLHSSARPKLDVMSIASAPSRPIALNSALHYKCEFLKGPLEPISLSLSPKRCTNNLPRFRSGVGMARCHHRCNGRLFQQMARG